jgi:hypothetical protein
MTAEIVQAFYLDRSVTISAAELVERSGLSVDELRDLVDVGAFAPVDARAWTFTVDCLAIARTAHRLREELALDDTHALALVMRLTQRVSSLEEEIARLRARMQG